MYVVQVFIGNYEKLVEHLSYDEDEGGLSRAAMFGLVIGSLLVLILIVLTVACCVYHRKQNEKTRIDNTRQRAHRLMYLPPLDGGVWSYKVMGSFHIAHYK